jgi:hypothetical protein
MSKASESFTILGLEFKKNRDGVLQILDHELDPTDLVGRYSGRALELRDWLTETFDEPEQP